jgi:uncharacterized membrane protein
MTASTPGGLSAAATGAEIESKSSPEPGPPALERTIGRLLTVGTYVSIGLLAIGLVGMLASGTGPLSGGPALDLGRVPGDLVALHPAGFLWLGLIVAIATPSARVAASLVGFLLAGERAMAVVAALILIVIALSVVLAIGLEG